MASCSCVCRRGRCFKPPSLAAALRTAIAVGGASCRRRWQRREVMCGASHRHRRGRRFAPQSSAAVLRASISAAPWPCARRVRRAKSHLKVLYFLTLVPQVKYVTLVMDLGATRTATDLPRSGDPRFFGGIVFVDLIFDLVFVSCWGSFRSPESAKVPPCWVPETSLENCVTNFRVRDVFGLISSPSDP